MQCQLPFQESHSSDDDDNDPVQSAVESHMPSAVPDKEGERTYCWFFESTLDVGEEHIVDNQISKTIVKDVFKAHAQDKIDSLKNLKVITFSL